MNKLNTRKSPKFALGLTLFGALLGSQVAAAYQPHPAPAPVLMPHFLGYPPVAIRPMPAAQPRRIAPLQVAYVPHHQWPQPRFVQPHLLPQAIPFYQAPNSAKKAEEKEASQAVADQSTVKKATTLQVRPRQSDSVSAPTVPATPQQPTALADSKEAFIALLEPIVRRENQRLLMLRQQLQTAFQRLEAGENLTESETAEIRRLAKSYRVKQNPITELAGRTALLHKIDVIPTSLAIAQAVNESAWGTSRFAREGNNLFGIWTYDASKGIVPKGRAAGAKHLVRRFDTFDEGVRYYMLNLNRHAAYASLRNIRAELRAQGEDLDSISLAAGLTKYSAKGEEYVHLIRDIIHRYNLAQLDSLKANQG